MGSPETCPVCEDFAAACRHPAHYAPPPAPRDEAPATREPGVVGACEILEALQSPAAASATGREAEREDVPGAAEFRDAFKKAVPPRGADLASWVNGYCAGWIACYAALRRGGEGAAAPTPADPTNPAPAPASGGAQATQKEP